MNECQKIPTSPSVLPGLILLKFKCLNVVFDYEFAYLIKAKLLLCDLRMKIFFKSRSTLAMAFHHPVNILLDGSTKSSCEMPSFVP